MIVKPARAAMSCKSELNLEFFIVLEPEVDERSNARGAEDFDGKDRYGECGTGREWMPAAEFKLKGSAPTRRLILAVNADQQRQDHGNSCKSACTGDREAVQNCERDIEGWGPEKHPSETHGLE